MAKKKTEVQPPVPRVELKQQLQTEIDRLQFALKTITDVEKAEKELEQEIFGRFLLRNIDLLLSLCPYHENKRSTTEKCSDKERAAHIGDCSRCTLLDVKSEVGWRTEWPKDLLVRLDVLYR